MTEPKDWLNWLTSFHCWRERWREENKRQSSFEMSPHSARFYLPRNCLRKATQRTNESSERVSKMKIVWLERERNDCRWWSCWTDQEWNHSIVRLVRRRDDRVAKALHEDQEDPQINRRENEERDSKRERELTWSLPEGVSRTSWNCWCFLKSWVNCRFTRLWVWSGTTFLHDSIRRMKNERRSVCLTEDLILSVWFRWVWLRPVDFCLLISARNCDISFANLSSRVEIPRLSSSIVSIHRWDVRSSSPFLLVRRRTFDEHCPTSCYNVDWSEDNRVRSAGRERGENLLVELLVCSLDIRWSDDSIHSSV